jgi:hypothetical protein
MYIILHQKILSVWQVILVVCGLKNARITYIFPLKKYEGNPIRSSAKKINN